jgi:hypothetical protein
MGICVHSTIYSLKKYSWNHFEGNKNNVSEPHHVHTYMPLLVNIFDAAPHALAKIFKRTKVSIIQYCIYVVEGEGEANF